MADELSLAASVPAARPARVRKGRHVAALITEMQAVVPMAKRYRAASHVSTERARRRVLAVCRIVLASIPGDGRRRGSKVQSLEVGSAE